MQEIINAFGIDWRLIVIQIFNFTLLLALLWYFLYKPVLQLIETRRQKIEQGVRDAEASAQALKEAEGTKGTILSEAHADAEAIVARARAHAQEQEGELLAEAHTRSARVMQEAEERAKEIANTARKESEREVARLAVLAAEKVIRERSG